MVGVVEYGDRAEGMPPGISGEDRVQDPVEIFRIQIPLAASHFAIEFPKRSRRRIQAYCHSSAVVRELNLRSRCALPNARQQVLGRSSRGRWQFRLVRIRRHRLREIFADGVLSLLHEIFGNRHEAAEVPIAVTSVISVKQDGSDHRAPGRRPHCGTPPPRRSRYWP